jgi:hypothetical protein
MSLGRKLTFVLSFFCSLSLAQKGAYKLIIHNNGYIGRINISGEKDYIQNGRKTDSSLHFFFLHDNDTITMKPDAQGYYYLNTGATIGDFKKAPTSFIAIYFSPSGSGQIDSIYPKESASYDKSSKHLTLNTILINIDPNGYDREWYPSFGVKNLPGIGESTQIEFFTKL